MPKPQLEDGRNTADYDDEAIRERWDNLMDLSTEIEVEVDGHPAFAGIVSQLHPDEARILRLPGDVRPAGGG